MRKEGKATLQLTFVLGEVQGAGAAPLGSSSPFPTGSSFPGRWQPRGLTRIPGSVLRNNLIHHREETAEHGWEGSAPISMRCPKAPQLPVLTGCRSPGLPGEECPAIQLFLPRRLCLGPASPPAALGRMGFSWWQTGLGGSPLCSLYSSGVQGALAALQDRSAAASHARAAPRGTQCLCPTCSLLSCFHLPGSLRCPAPV